MFKLWFASQVCFAKNVYWYNKREAWIQEQQFLKKEYCRENEKMKKKIKNEIKTDVCQKYQPSFLRKEMSEIDFEYYQWKIHTAPGVNLSSPLSRA